MSIWDILGIEPTRDMTAIKRAYAKQTIAYNPEEYMEEFLKIRAAYKSAVAFAGNPEKAETETAVPGDTAAETESAVLRDTAVETESAESKDTEDKICWDFLEDQDDDTGQFENCAAILKFREMYFDKKCKDKNLWISYFASPEFLDVFREKGFTGLLLRDIQEKGAGQPANRAFLEILCLVYQISSTNERDVLPHGVKEDYYFEGMEHIRTLAKLGMVKSRLKGTEMAILNGYGDFLTLLSLTRNGIWSSEIAFSFGKIIDRYVMTYIHDKVPQDMNVNALDYLPRHTSSLKLLLYFCEHMELPEQAYAIVWNKLDLKNAKMGRSKVFYGGLRECILKKYPDFESIEKESFSDFRSYFTKFCVSLSEDASSLQNQVDDFFEREDVKRALMSSSYVEEDVLKIWVTSRRATYFLIKLADYCSGHNEVFLAERIIKMVQGELRRRSAKAALEEDENSSADEEAMLMFHRAFFRYYLNIAFPRAYGFEFPNAPSWDKRFLGYEEETDELTDSRTMSWKLDSKNQITMVLHLHYAEYFLNNQPVYAPCLDFHELLKEENQLLFWFSLPLCYAHVDEKAVVREEILKRLEAFPFSQDIACSDISDSIAVSVCQAYDKNYKPYLLTIYREHCRYLYTCNIYPQEYSLQIYKTEANGARTILAEDSFTEAEDGVLLGQRLLGEFCSPFPLLNLVMEVLPETVRMKRRNALPEHYTAEEITLEKIREILSAYVDKKGERLELVWGGRSLVLLTRQNLSACFCFDNVCGWRYTLLSRPEVYQTADSGEILFVPFGHGKLESYCIHKNLLCILINLNRVIREVSDLANKIPHDMNLWALQVYLHRPSHYEMDKRLLGGYPIVPENMDTDKSFLITNFPDRIIWESTDKKAEQMNINSATRLNVSESLVDFLKGRLRRLILTWGSRHLVLLQESGLSMLLYLDDFKQAVECLVADVDFYCRVEGKKYPKSQFFGRTYADYLLHKDYNRIHSYLSVLLPCIEEPESILGIFGEFSYGTPYVCKNEAPDYEELRKEYCLFGSLEDEKKV